MDDGCTSRRIWSAQTGLGEPFTEKEDLKFRVGERVGPRGTGGRQRGEYDPKHYEILKEITKMYF